MEKQFMNFKVNIPEKDCKDVKCPFHGSLKVRGRNFVGVVISSKMHKTAVVEWEWKHFLPKYSRYEKKRTKVKAHNPECIDAQEGFKVRIAECRPLSKTKNFVIVESYGKEKGYKEKMEARQEAKVEQVKKPEQPEQKQKKHDDEETAESDE